MKNYFFLLCFMCVACFSNCQREQLIAQTKPSAGAISPIKSATATSVLTDFKDTLPYYNPFKLIFHSTKNGGSWSKVGYAEYEKINNIVDFQKVHIQSTLGSQMPNGGYSIEEELWFNELPLIKDKKIVLNDAHYYIFEEGGCSSLACYDIDQSPEKDNYVVFTNIDTLNRILEGYFSASFEMDAHSKEKNDAKKNKKPERMDFLNGEFRIKLFLN